VSRRKDRAGGCKDKARTDRSAASPSKPAESVEHGLRKAVVRGRLKGQIAIEPLRSLNKTGAASTARGAWVWTWADIGAFDFVAPYTNPRGGRANLRGKLLPFL